jgi:hypothetical protein
MLVCQSRIHELRNIEHHAGRDAEVQVKVRGLVFVVIQEMYLRLGLL